MAHDPFLGGHCDWPRLVIGTRIGHQLLGTSMRASRKLRCIRESAFSLFDQPGTFVRNELHSTSTHSTYVLCGYLECAMQARKEIDGLPELRKARMTSGISVP